jgi:hypothetical protein
LFRNRTYVSTIFKCRQGYKPDKDFKKNRTGKKKQAYQPNAVAAQTSVMITCKHSKWQSLNKIFGRLLHGYTMISRVTAQLDRQWK